jgi:4-hydroxybenzoyl-CoA reductase alpha subunit
MIGKRIPRIDSNEKVTGKAIYGIDVKLPGMLYGKILRSPFPHARIVHINTEKAKKKKGVKAVITAEDTPKVKYGAQIDDEYLLALDRVRYIGDEIAAVAAIDEETAIEALDLIRVEYEELPAVFTPWEALKTDAPRIHDKADNIVTHIEFERGDIKKGLLEADHILESTFRTSNVHQLYLEPHVCVSQVDGNGKITIWASLQAPARNRDLIAKALNMPPEKIQIIQTVVGGAFGGKASQVVPLYPICALLALKAGRPVRILNTWEEEFASSRSRMPTEIKIKIGVKKDGIFIFKDMQILANCGAYAGTGPALINTAATRATNLYRFKNVKCNATLVYTNSTPIGSYRGYGNPQPHFALESIIDEAAERLAMDPLDLRVKNASQEGDTTVHGWVLNSCRLIDCLKTAAEKSGWKEKRSKKKEEGKGIGLAAMIHVSGNRSVYPFYDGSSAYVRINPHGRVDVISGEAEIGQGANTVFAQIVAEILGVEITDIWVVPLTTDHSPYALGTFASRVTTLGGKAVQMAAEDAKKQLLEIASTKMGVPVDKLECSGGSVHLKGNLDQGMQIAEVAKLAFYASAGAPIIGVGKFLTPPSIVIPDQTKYGNISIAYSFGAQVAEVEVDHKTGKVKILNFLSVHDSGAILNPMLSEGQVEGGVLQGIGYALFEEIQREKGRVINENFTDYRIPTISDAPHVSSFFIEYPDPFGPFGAKGLGEITLVGTAPAIANAIYDAVGIRLKEIPFTPERILYSFRERK